MANTYAQIYLQFVFAVKYRKALIHPIWKVELNGVIGNLINKTGCKTYIVNGVEDHMHCLVSLRPSVSPSELMKSVKAKSSKYINDHKLTAQRFEWQRGFGVFSYSKVAVDNVFKYIERQEKHHKRETFKEEYLKLLKEFEVEYDEAYLFEDLI
ncbi:REP element-mobilizing transposase RayT [Gelidibacter algens]|jgi:REP element-mobilizing transposase RayT|uniref:REP element-mobilizing transposase RayT n=1 Tax=Gelidibacter algens TaxID=49280 RepID=A0A1A7QZ90_9FLAO|nr:IS200/IS605 family transposase [Gelidibacter algens]OBX24583.1 transposase [Gelidibacter algens]RAJ19705.1 REP element-mobilizing transposase RayT [Gelidibacter algens]